ncbi:hypothetical protein [Actinomadura rugatobispora]|uniref:Uncharacterized protein n=1 Tax=Actinomadura rugatobispora TaxID=1994 RepID=A0ABW1AB72_9ACTN
MYLLAVFGGICAVGLLIAWIDGVLVRRAAVRRRAASRPGPRSSLVGCGRGSNDPDADPDRRPAGTA